MKPILDCFNEDIDKYQNSDVRDKLISSMLINTLHKAMVKMRKI